MLFTATALDALRVSFSTLPPSLHYTISQRPDFGLSCRTGTIYETHAHDPSSLNHEQPLSAKLVTEKGDGQIMLAEALRYATQNLLLQAVALDLGAVPIGAFQDGPVQAALSRPADHQLLYLIPVGHPR